MSKDMNLIKNKVTKSFLERHSQPLRTKQADFRGKFHPIIEKVFLLEVLSNLPLKTLCG